MLKCEISRQKMSVGVKGTITELQADVCILINKIHESLREADAEEETGGCFAGMFKEFVRDALYNLTLADEKEYKEFMEQTIEDLRKKVKQDLRRADD